MKRILFTVFVLCLYSGFAGAQRNRWTVKPGEKIDEALAANVKFHYPQFTEGHVYFRDGTTSRASLNYNLLAGEMQFVSPKGDTLAVANEATIRYIVINEDSFYYDKGYLQLVTGNTVVKLAKKVRLTLGDIKKIGAYDQPSSASSITTIASLDSHDRVTRLTENKELTIVKETTYFVGDNYNHFVQASKKNVLKLFGKNEKAIEQYLKEKNVRFNNEADLKDLISFLAL